MSAEKRKLGSSSNDYIELIKKSSSHWELILNRPDKFNAITSDMYERMIQIFDDAAKDEELVLLSITGKGKYYSAGTDLTDPAKSFVRVYKLPLFYIFIQSIRCQQIVMLMRLLKSEKIE